MVWTSYWMDGTFATSSLLVRLLEFRAGMMHGHSAILVLSTPITSSDEEARARLASFLKSRSGLASGLARAGAQPAS
jgi:hypothetical protein